MVARELITNNLSRIVREMTKEPVDVQVSISEKAEQGDYYTNVALRLASILKKKPLDIAYEIKNEFEKEIASSSRHGGTPRNDSSIIAKIETAPPGFVNFFLSEQYLTASMIRIIEAKEEFGRSDSLKNKKMMVEFAHPNTHKEFHIGHLRNITLGESICRLLAALGAQVSRVNYQGDVGMHVAKALYGLLQNSKFKIPRPRQAKRGGQNSKFKRMNPLQKAQVLGEAYAAGSKAYEESDAAKKEIGEINKKIYARDPEILFLWEKTREWSLEYFEVIYKRVRTSFDRLFFESEVYEEGKKVVLAHISDGIFVKSDGAIIFPGEKYGLHNRVFVTREGNPTYEGKEMGLGPLQYKEFQFDEAIHVVGPEQAAYFEVVFKALELINPVFAGREKHLSYGFVQLKDSKMSSRLGNIVRGEWLLDEAKNRIAKSFPKIDNDTCEAVAVAAVKYSLLKVGRASEIQFSFDESISLEGNSGPYLQYTYVRTESVINKYKISNIKNKKDIAKKELNPEELAVLRSLVHFPEVVSEAQLRLAPNLVASYLFDLAQKFNLFYQKHRIADNSFRLRITAAVGHVLRNGLGLLGIETVEKM